MNKSDERFWAEEVGRLLELKWRLEEREAPDFLVAEDETRFGLEIVEVFAGRVEETGSVRKKEESVRQKAIDRIQQEFESKVQGTPLNVRLMGDMSSENVAAFQEQLLDMVLEAKPIGHQSRIRIDKGPAALVAYVTRSFRSVWFYVGDRVGWMNRSAADRVQDAIAQKATKLEAYKLNCKLDDIRLVIVANHKRSSGMLSLEGNPMLDLKGFHTVYFLDSPSGVRIFTGTNKSGMRTG